MNGLRILTVIYKVSSGARIEAECENDPPHRSKESVQSLNEERRSLELSRVTADQTATALHVIKKKKLKAVT